MTDVRVTRLSIRCHAPPGDPRIGRTRARLLRIAADLLPAALARTLGPGLTGSPGRLVVPLDFDPADHDDETVATLWADRIRRALVPRLHAPDGRHGTEHPDSVPGPAPAPETAGHPTDDVDTSPEAMTNDAGAGRAVDDVTTAGSMQGAGAGRAVDDAAVIRHATDGGTTASGPAPGDAAAVAESPPGGGEQSAGGSVTAGHAPDGVGTGRAVDDAATTGHGPGGATAAGATPGGVGVGLAADGSAATGRVPGGGEQTAGGSVTVSSTPGGGEQTAGGSVTAGPAPGDAAAVAESTPGGGERAVGGSVTAGRAPGGEGQVTGGSVTAGHAPDGVGTGRAVDDAAATGHAPGGAGQAAGGSVTAGSTPGDLGARQAGDDAAGGGGAALPQPAGRAGDGDTGELPEAAGHRTPPPPSATGGPGAGLIPARAGPAPQADGWMSRAGGLVLLYPWLADHLQESVEFRPELDPVTVRRVALAALAGEDRFTADPLVLLLAGADPGDPPPPPPDVPPDTALAEAVLARFAAVLPGFADSSPGYVREMFLLRLARLLPYRDGVTARLEPKPLDPVLQRLPYPLGIFRLPWSPVLSVRLEGA